MLLWAILQNFDNIENNIRNSKATNDSFSIFIKWKSTQDSTQKNCYSKKETQKCEHHFTYFNSREFVNEVFVLSKIWNERKAREKKDHSYLWILTKVLPLKVLAFKIIQDHFYSNLKDQENAA